MAAVGYEMSSRCSPAQRRYRNRFASRRCGFQPIGPQSLLPEHWPLIVQTSALDLGLCHRNAGGALNWIIDLNQYTAT
jgi:hypothetical protein